MSALVCTSHHLSLSTSLRTAGSTSKPGIPSYDAETRMSFSPEMKEAGLSSCFGRLDEKESRWVWVKITSLHLSGQ